MSLRRFFIGIVLFAISAGLIIFGYLHLALLQLPGLVLLPIALYFAMYGYLGIFANRFSQILKDREKLNKDLF
ncbi:hypothetical protein [Pseudoalteromonas sp. C2R02]|uniref:hypothetical protein n=1 Tax=Pseudoalteromonas sp. C2R02 TaxID=2841565 RepID=UPI002090E240|nr:hypothetical protein [Pseudoalteromonas sp. C2R02]